MLLLLLCLLFTWNFGVPCKTTAYTNHAVPWSLVALLLECRDFDLHLYTGIGFVVSIHEPRRAHSKQILAQDHRVKLEGVWFCFGRCFQFIRSAPVAEPTIQMKPTGVLM